MNKRKNRRRLIFSVIVVGTLDLDWVKSKGSSRIPTRNGPDRT